MNKYFDGDIYIIDGIDSTAQLLDFYNEVVEKNIEKYYGITVQKRRFEYDENKKKAVVLGEDKPYAINPNYRKIEPVQETVQEPEPVSDAVVVVTEPESQVGANYENIEVTVNAEKVTVVNEQVEEPKIDDENEQLRIELEQVKETLRATREEMALALERAEVAEAEWERISTKNKELRAELEAKEVLAQADAQKQPENNRLNELLDELKSLGYEAFIKRI